MSETFEDLYEPSHSIVSLWANKVEGRSHAVLFVDDEPEWLEIVARAFRNKYRVFTAANATEAKKIIGSEIIAAVISDQMMPGEMNGVDLLAWVRENHPLTTRVLMTAYQDSDPEHGSINKAHVRYYLMKPIDLDALAKAVRLSVATSVIARRYRDAVAT